MVWDLRSLCDTADYAISRYAINRIRLYSLLLTAEDNGLLWAKEEDEVLNELKLTEKKE